MKRHNSVPAIPPFVDFYGRPTFENPAGQYRPNPALTAPVRESAVEAPIVQQHAAATNATRDEAQRRAELSDALAQLQRQAARAAAQARLTTSAAMIAEAPIVPRAERIAGLPLVPRAQRIAEARARMHRRVRRTAVAMLAVVGVLGSSAGAYAYFSASGSGTGSAGSGTLAAPTVEAATGTVSTKLLPNNATADLIVQVNNPNSFPVTITDIAQGAGSIAVTGASGTCTTTGVTVPTQHGLSVSVASGDPSVAHIANGVQMGTTSDSGCQGASFHIPVSITVQTP